MCPVNHPTPRVPFVLSVELDNIANLQGRNPVGDIDVMRNQDRLTRDQSKYETLVSAAVPIVREDTGNPTPTGNLNVTALIRVGLAQTRSVGRRKRRDILVARRYQSEVNAAKIHNRQQNYAERQFLHANFSRQPSATGHSRHREPLDSTRNAGAWTAITRRPPGLASHPPEAAG
jgi:hypothetical protein